MDTLFSDWLYSEISKRNWTGADLARHANLTRQAINNYLNGNRRNPDETALIAIAHALNMPPDVVFRAAGILPPISEIDERLARLAYVYKNLSPDVQEEILNNAEFRLQQAQRRLEQQRAAQRIKTGPLGSHQ